MTSVKEVLQKVDGDAVGDLQRLAKLCHYQLFRTTATSRLRARSLTAEEARVLVKMLWKDR